MVMVVVAGADMDEKEKETDVNENKEKAKLKIELCLYFQICFISDAEIRTDMKEGRQEHTPRFRQRPPPAPPTARTTASPGTTTPSPLKIRIQKVLENCFAGNC